MNATAGKIDADAEIRCWVMPEDTTLERLLVVAAAANTIRSAMNPIEEMEAYSAMAQAGIKVRAIAETFGIAKKVVEQRIAIGNLAPSARDLVRSGTRQIDRKSVVLGKSVSVRVDLGGRRICKKKKQNKLPT